VARHCGTDHVATYLGDLRASHAASAGYFRVPGQGMTLVANPRQPLPVNVFDWQSWDLSLGDLEVF
jgi:hypothetical protein